jgi:multiple sugar transport system permease protein
MSLETQRLSRLPGSRTRGGGVADRGRPGQRPAPRARRLRRVLVPALFLSPVIVYALLFFAYPLVFGFVMSFENFNFEALVQGSGPFVGLANYRAVLADPVTIAALRNTVIFTVASVLFQVVISLGLAMLLNQRYFLGGLLRRLILIPWLIPLVATGTIFAQLFGAQNSLVNSVLQHLGIIHSPIGWLIHYTPAMTALILVNIWAGLPFNTIVLYSGLQDLDQSVYEAAKVDGANAWQRFVHITLPLLRPVIAIVTMIGIIATVKVFDLVVVITGGGPNNATQLLSTWAYTQAFTNFNFGQGAAIGNILLVLSIIVAIFYVKTLRREDA